MSRGERNALETVLDIVQLRILECNEKPVFYNVYFALCWDESVVDWCLLFVFLFLGREEGELLPIIAAVLERNGTDIW